MHDDDDPDEQMRRLEASLQRVMDGMDRNTRVQVQMAGSVRDTVNAIPDVVSNAFNDAAFEQAPEIGRKFADALSTPTNHLVDSVQSMMQAMVRLTEAQAKSSRALFRALMICGVLLGALIAGNVLLWGLYFDLGAGGHAVDERPHIEIPRALPEPPASSN